MSLKLHITIDGKEFPVYPTPNYITHIDLYQKYTREMK